MTPKSEILEALIQAKGYEQDCIEADPTFNNRSVTGDYRDVTEYAFAYLFDWAREEAETYGIDCYGKSVDEMIAAVSAIEDAS